ncbi:MAG: hypothetical protein WBO35_02845 [Candidatus Saccharimonadales bacterium]
MTAQNDPNLGAYVESLREKWEGPGVLGGEFALLPRTQQVTTVDGATVMTPLFGEQAPRGSELGDTWVDLPQRIEDGNRVLGQMVTDNQVNSKET